MYSQHTAFLWTTYGAVISEDLRQDAYREGHAQEKAYGIAGSGSNRQIVACFAVSAGGDTNVNPPVSDASRE